MACGCSSPTNQGGAKPSCAHTPATQPAPRGVAECLCYVLTLPATYAGALFDLAFDGKTPIKQTLVQPKPNTHTYELGLDALPDGYVWDAVAGLLYFPIGYTPRPLAVWVRSAQRDAKGCYTWTATPYEGCANPVDCEVATLAKYNLPQPEAIPLTAIKKCDGTNLNPVADRVPTCAQHDADIDDLQTQIDALGNAADVSLPANGSATFNAANNTFTLTQTDNSPYTIPATGLIDAIKALFKKCGGGAVNFTSDQFALCANIDALQAQIDALEDVKLDISIPITYDPLTNLFTLTLTDGTTATISATSLIADTLSLLKKCGGAPLDPLADEIVTCAQFNAHTHVAADGIQGQGTTANPFTPDLDALPADVTPTGMTVIASTTAQPDGARVETKLIFCDGVSNTAPVAFDPAAELYLIQKATTPGAPCEIVKIAGAPTCAVSDHALTPQGWGRVRQGITFLEVADGDTVQIDQATHFELLGDVTVDAPAVAGCAWLATFINLEPAGADVTVTVNSLNGTAQVLTLIGFANPAWLSMFGENNQGESLSLAWNPTAGTYRLVEG